MKNLAVIVWKKLESDARIIVLIDERWYFDSAGFSSIPVIVLEQHSLKRLWQKE